MPVKTFHNFYFRNLLAVLLIGAGYALYIVPQFLNIGGMMGFCMFRSVTGLPCPGCGMGRASIQISQGNLIEAFYTNPLAIPFAVCASVAFLWIAIDLIRRKETFLPLMKTRLKLPYLLVLMTVIIVVWVRNIVLNI